jgi:hypothetical protein
MKKIGLILLFICFLWGFIFGDNNEIEELDFLLFQPNVSNAFVNEEQAFMQLDKLAEDILGKNLSAGQIYVYGYAAIFQNDIDPINLSRDRAAFVISELQKRGVLMILFSEPIGHGSVNLWANNTNEEDRRPNRRVRVLVNNNTSAMGRIEGVPKKEIIGNDNNSEDEKEVENKNINFEFGNLKFPWWILIIIFIILILGLVLFAPLSVLSKVCGICCKMTVNSVISILKLFPRYSSSFNVNLSKKLPETPPRKYHGGKHGDLIGGGGIERHHMPPWNAFAQEMKDMDRNEMPAIQMEKEDHAQTLGFSGRGSDLDKLYEKYLKKGNYIGAVRACIKDVKGKFPHKYDDAIKEYLPVAIKYGKEVFQPYYKKINMKN